MLFRKDERAEEYIMLLRWIGMKGHKTPLQAGNVTVGFGFQLGASSSPHCARRWFLGSLDAHHLSMNEAACAAMGRWIGF